MALIRSKNRTLDSLGALLAQELMNLDELDGFVLSDIKIPNVDRYNPFESELVLLLPQGIFLLTPLEFQPGDYRISKRNALEWQKRRFDSKKPHPGLWCVAAELPNPLQNCLRKAKAISDFAVNVDVRFSVYKIVPIVVVPDHVSICDYGDTCNSSIPPIVTVATFIDVLKQKVFETKAKKFKIVEVEKLFNALENLPAEDYASIEMNNFTVERAIPPTEIGCLFQVKYFKGKQKLTGTECEIRIYRKWPWNSKLERFLNAVEKRLKSVENISEPVFPKLLYYNEFPDIVQVIFRQFQGENLRNIVKKHGCFEKAMAIEIIRHIAHKIEKLHEIGIIHSDIRPEHVMLSDKIERSLADNLLLGGILNPFIDDEIIASSIYEDRFDLSFIPPEINTYKHLERGKPASDIFSLGRLLCYMICGEVNYLFRLSDKGLDLSGIDSEIRSVIERATADFSKARFRSIKEFILALN